MNVPSIESLLVDEKRKTTPLWYNFFKLFAKGYTGTITTAPLTGGGTTGSMTFENGVLVSQVAAT